MKLLFPVLNGNYADMVSGVINSIKHINSNVDARVLWYTQAYQKKEITRQDASLRLLERTYRIPRNYEDTYYRALRYKNIDLMDVIRINMIDTPEVPIEKLLRYAIRYLYICENYLKDEEIVGVIFLLGRGLFQRCVGTMARSLNIPTYYLCDAFIPGKTTHIWRKEEEVSDDLKNIPIPRLTKQQRKELYHFIQRQTQITSITPSPYKPSSLSRRIKSFFILLTQDRLVGNRTALRLLYYMFLQKYRKYTARKYYKPLPKQNYFFLPAQVFYDFHLPLYWAEYTNLEYFVDVCRKALPPGYTLVVKEHPHLKGSISRKMIRNISRMKNVIVVDVDANPQDILRGCTAVITNTSSMGWQAMMHDKPTILVRSRSHPDYQYYYGEYSLTMNTFEENLSLAMSIAIIFIMDRNIRDSFLYHVILDRYKGTDKLCPVDYNRMNEENNSDIIAGYLMEKMKEDELL